MEMTYKGPGNMTQWFILNPVGSENNPLYSHFADCSRVCTYLYNYILSEGQYGQLFSEFFSLL